MKALEEEQGDTGTGSSLKTGGWWPSPAVPPRRHRPWRAEGAGGWLRLAGILSQLGLILWMAQWLGLERERGFTRPADSWPEFFNPLRGGLLSWLAAAFVGQLFIPLWWRVPYFVAISLGGFLLLMGWAEGGLLILLGLGLIGLCHAPLPFRWRVGLVVAAGLLLGLWRGGVYGSGEMMGVPMMLGTLFMFRMMIYLYDLRNERAGVTPWQRLAYFFLAPNGCFPLFPVVDYSTFLRTWHDDRELTIYQKGVHWMSRGVVHLVLYRLVYLYFSPAEDEVSDVADLGVYVVSSYLIYLRISGQFHLIIGLLCLFGFNLPETHHRYLLASGFSDYWRRINLYWKDFMMKLVFYPAYVRLKGLGHLPAIALGTALVFLATWILHAYQWFWLRGRFHFSLTDALFWAIFAVLVMGNALREASRKAESPRGGDGKFDWAAAVSRSLRTGGLFLLICLLFTFWQSESVGRFFSLIGGAARGDVGRWTLVLGVTVAALALGVLVPWARHRLRGAGLSLMPPSSWTAPLGTVLPLVLILCLSAGIGGEKAAGVMVALRDGRLNERDQRRLDRGYYEGLLQTRETFASPLWELRLERRPDWRPMEGSGMSRATGDLLHQELIPNQDTMINGVRWVTNRWGMHDLDHYEREKPEGVYRIALLSASYGAGYGMETAGTFENLAEEALNRMPGLTADRIEILNFSVPGYTLIEFVAFLETRIAAFEPDAFYLVTHSKEGPRTLGTLARRIREGVPLTYDYLDDLKKRAEIPENPTDQDLRRLSKFRHEIEDWGYGRMVEFCRDRGIKPVWIHLPVTDEEVDREALGQQQDRAGEAGFFTMRLEEPYGEGDRREIWLAPDDRHPNAEGHRRVAESLLGQMRENAVELGLPFTR